jgi:hypothetical protein
MYSELYVYVRHLQVVVNALHPLPYANLLSLVTDRAFPEIDFRN